MQTLSKQPPNLHSTWEELSTFSIVAFDPHTRDLGVAVQSKYFSVGPIVPWAEPGVGAIATQARANVSYGPEGLKLLEGGLSVQEVIRTLTSTDEDREFRQLGIVDSKGNAEAYTGSNCTPWAGSRTGRNYAAQGNILEREDVVVAMAEAFESARGEVAERLLFSLKAGQSAGGDARGRQSAAILVVRKGKGPFGFGDKYIELRVEDHKTPILELQRLLNMHYSNEYVRESNLLMDEGKFEDAMSLAVKAVERSSENDTAHMSLCKAYYNKGDIDLSIDEFTKAVELNNNLRGWVRKSPMWSFIAEDNRFKIFF